MTVQGALGHSTATTTLNTYSHLWPTAENRTRTAASDLMRDALQTAAASDDRLKVERESEGLGDLHDRGEAGVAIG